MRRVEAEGLVGPGIDFTVRLSVVLGIRERTESEDGKLGALYLYQGFPV